MITPQFSLDLNAELIVDNFAGGGGASTGIELALGRHVDHAINHCREALGMHRINHLQTVHHHEDVFDIDPATVCEGRPVGLAHFSPDCKHHSKAKGGKPVDKKIRGLVVVMLRWAKYGARVMTMENVEEIVKWGPLKRMFKKGEWGWYPDPAHEGRTWKAFLACLSTGIAANHPDLPEIVEVLAGTVTAEECVRGFGYKYEAREIRACDFGTPTIRRRLFMVSRCDGRSIVFPEPTHFQSPSRGEKPWRAIAECIDWARPCPSIFDDSATIKARFGFHAVRPLADSTLRRVATGIDRYVLKTEDRSWSVSRIRVATGSRPPLRQPRPSPARIEARRRWSSAASTAAIVGGPTARRATGAPGNRSRCRIPPTGSGWRRPRWRRCSPSTPTPATSATSRRASRCGRRAQGFGEHYVIERAWVVDPRTGEVAEVTLTKEQQIRMCGNSVCPQPFAAIVAANVPELATWDRAARQALAEGRAA